VSVFNKNKLNSYKDERASKLALFSMLEKSFLDRIIRKEEVALFEKELKPHQKVKMDWEEIVREKERDVKVM
jgi:hypothetical protein